MWPFIQPINLIRYLCIWRVNRALVRLPTCLPGELSQMLGTLIAERLPSRQARLWRRALATPAPQHPVWPIESVLFTYPGKRYCGPGEPILWELKLLGPQADHNFFLEMILPAMETASHTTDSRWYQSNTLWGRFDIQAIYVARGSRWEPLVQEGRLDTTYQATPLQWADGLSFIPAPKDERTFTSLHWLTPVDLRPLPTPSGSLEVSPDKASSQSAKIEIPIPTLQLLLDALLTRVAQLASGKYTTPGDVWQRLPPDEQSALWDAVAQADQVTVRQAELQAAPKQGPQGWLGEQTFAAMPPSMLPYLELASILHLGRHTHLGCGTFMS